MDIPFLDDIVCQSLDFFKANIPPGLSLDKYKLPFVIGSGNALNTGKIIFSEKAAIFADESNFISTISSYNTVINKGLIKDAIIISASGEKDSVWETEVANKYGLKTTLLTCNPKSSAAKIADRVYGYQSISEPYTYNTSTYLGIILSYTKEDPAKITKYLQNLILPKEFGKYQSYAFVLPDKYIHLALMINIKSDELFGPYLVIRAFTEGHARHAKFIHPWEKELVISIGQKNKYFGHPDHRYDIEIPEYTNFGLLLSLCYFLCGKIQSSKPQYFKRNIVNFCRDYGPKAYGKNQHFEVIVPGQTIK